MSWRRLLQQLMNQEQVIRKLEDSAPIRKAAKFTVYLVQRGKQVAQQGFYDIKNSKVLKDAEDTAYTRLRESGKMSQYEAFKNRFASEIEKGFNEQKQNLKKRRRK